MIACGDRLGPAIAQVRLQHPPGGPQRLLQVLQAIPRVPQLTLKPVLDELDLGHRLRQLVIAANGSGDGRTLGAPLARATEKLFAAINAEEAP